MQPSEVMQMIYFEYEWMLDDIKEYQKEKQSQAEAQEKEQQQLQRSMRNPMGNFKQPSFTMPKMPSVKF